jgi:hypothetical protein
MHVITMVQHTWMLYTTSSFLAHKTRLKTAASHRFNNTFCSGVVYSWTIAEDLGQP